MRKRSRSSSNANLSITLEINNNGLREIYRTNIKACHFVTRDNTGKSACYQIGCQELVSREMGANSAPDIHRRLIEGKQ